MLYLVKLHNAYGDDVLLRYFETKPEARGFRLRFNKLMENDVCYIEDIDEQDRCPGCHEYISNLIREGKIHDCQV